MSDGTPFPRFALNHMAAPGLELPAFFALASALGIEAVEIRNDIAGKAIVDGTSASEVRSTGEKAGLSILTINALQRFNEWTPAREREAVELADYAAACGAQALVLVPVNDGSGREDGKRQENLRHALQHLKTILDARSLRGFVEPLGFEICSLRSKKEALAAIEAVGGRDTFRLVHDTFHHHLAGEPEIFAAMTGLVHISGVDDPAVTVAAMRDPHRVLVTGDDRIGNLAQIQALCEGGYDGWFSFEPFAPSVHTLVDPAVALRQSMDFIRHGRNGSDQ
ncbi:MAG TPA: TIM barrel protein [Rhizobiaceae bacterium]|nr:TIM barrel protein [Rhizobiaceae bacterium]